MIYLTQRLIVIVLLFGEVFHAYSQQGFTGQAKGPDNSVFLRNRYYDPETGTFLTKDPIGIAGGINTFQYCGNDPINNVDPSGQIAFWDTVIAGAIGGTIGVGIHFVGDIGTVLGGGNWSSGSSYAGAAAGGAAFGAMITVNPFAAGTAASAAFTAAAGAVGGGSGNLTSQIMDISSGSQSGFNGGSLAQASAIGAAGSVVGGVLLPAGLSQLSTQMKGQIGDSLSGISATLRGETTVNTEFRYDIPGVLTPTGRQGFSIVDRVTSDAENNITFVESKFGTSDLTTRQAQLQSYLESSGSPITYQVDQWSYEYFTAVGAGAGYFTGQNLPIGGVLLNQAAQLVGQNLSDITGAMYDPVSGQFVILGTNNPAPVKGINLDYLTTALQAVYGSAVPPFVTLVPSAIITSSATQTETITVIVYQHYPDQYTTYTVSGTFTSPFLDLYPNPNYGSGSSVIIFPGDRAYATMSYAPIWTGEDTTVDVELRGTDYGTDLSQATAFYTYDERNLMTGYGDKTNQIAYTYNGDAQRVSKTLNGTPTSYVIDANHSLFEVVQERNSSGAVNTSYTFGPTRLATWNGSAVTFELTDRLGSVRLVTDASGSVIQNYNYDVFGATR